jgi:ribosome-associated translation inhibitor RaiA
MRYQITGKQIDVGDALQTHVKTSMDAAVSKYAQRPTDATVIFSRSGAEFVCEATVPRGMRMKSTAPSTAAARKWKSSFAATSAG